MSERVCETCRRWQEGWCWLFGMPVMAMPAEGTCLHYARRPEGDPRLRSDGYYV